MANCRVTLGKLHVLNIFYDIQDIYIYAISVEFCAKTCEQNKFKCPFSFERYVEK